MTRLNVIFVSALRCEQGLGLPAMLESNMVHNRSTSIQSMLLFAAGNFMQVIEGEAELTRRELQRLFQSPHYTDSVVLNEQQVTATVLDGSSFGAHDLDEALVCSLPTGVNYFKLTQDAVAQRVRSGIARNLLMQFAADYS